MRWSAKRRWLPFASPRRSGSASAADAREGSTGRPGDTDALGRLLLAIRSVQQSCTRSWVGPELSQEKLPPATAHGQLGPVEEEQRPPAVAAPAQLAHPREVHDGRP